MNQPLTSHIFLTQNDAVDERGSGGFGDTSPVPTMSSTRSWSSVLSLLTLPTAGDKLRLVLDESVASGCCLFVFAAVRKKRRLCQTIQDEQVIISSMLDWLRHIKLRCV